MKKYLSLNVGLLLALTFVSCSSNDDSSTNEPLTGDYFPSTVNNIWTYDVTTTSTTNPELNNNNTDIVSIATASSDSFTTSVNPTPANGVINTILSSGTMTKTESTLSYSGSFDFFDQLGFNLDVTGSELSNFILYDLNVSNGNELSTFSNTITEDITLIEGQNPIPMTINFTLSNIAKSTIKNLSVGCESFTNVINTEIKLNIAVTISVDILGNGSITNLDLLLPQDIAVINNFFAKDIGLVRSITNQSFEINPAVVTLLELAGTSLEITSSTIDNSQDLVDYVLQ